MSVTPQLVTDARGLAALAERLEGAKVLALDTEFIREHSYEPRLELVQVATPEGEIALLDYRAIGWLTNDPFRERLKDPGVLKVLHAAEQDLEMFHQITGEVVAPIFDTQIAASLVGFGAKTGYGALVEAHAGVKLAKGEGFTDWGLRPLTAEQLAYAANDVRYLWPMAEQLIEGLRSRGRESWAEEEFERMRRGVTEALAARRDPDTLWKRVRGRSGLDSRGLALLRELARWREEEAQRRDRPRGGVLKDEVLVELARRAPTQASQLRVMRGIPARDLDKHGETLVGLVRRVLNGSTDDWPRPEPHAPPPDEASMALASLLQAVTTSISAEAEVASTVLATSGDLQRLAASRGGAATAEELEQPIFAGWRQALLGHRLQEVLQGRVRLGWDPEARRLLVEPREGA